MGVDWPRVGSTFCRVGSKKSDPWTTLRQHRMNTHATLGIHVVWVERQLLHNIDKIDNRASDSDNSILGFLVQSLVTISDGFIFEKISFCHHPADVYIR